ncbi:unnamed protein product [Miscanthus lutarioriparius]|uniref:Uncharacterized protein n=1 Tax=Miscanthus lutarioriparius TaxID=422564 RepID=A0A811Q8A4_9POAL|nr:unnamed protein product [Miscanthus lutarioriparius]
MEGEIFNPVHPEIPPGGALESAKPTPLAVATLEDPESAEPTPTVLGASEVSSDDFTSTIVAFVGMEVPEVPDEEIVDYEATPERVEVNVVYMSIDYYILGDDSAALEFNFATESFVPISLKLIDNRLNIIV